MELHSYAKTRSSRKWTIDQKRKLVENRITLDALFNKKSFNLVDSWIKLIKVSDFESFDIKFVRNQWINILLKYKNIVEVHANDSKIDINEETSEWEFFDKIYRWIKYKERLNRNYVNIISEEIDDESINQQLELFSTESSTEDELKPIKKSSVGQQILPNEQKQKINSTPNILLNSQNNNNSNLSSQLKPNIISKNNTTTTTNLQNKNNSGCSASNENIVSKLKRKENKEKINPTSNILLLNSQNIKNNNPNLLLEQNQSINSNNLQNNVLLSEICTPKQNQFVQEKTGGSGSNLERKSKKLHKRKSNKLKQYKNYRKYINYKKSSRKIERKLNTFCQIFAQIVEKDYPDINISNLLNSSDESSSTSD